jgi:hypothetical protein
VRINRGDASELLLVESPDWVFHDDPTVDVAVMEFPTVGFTRHDVRPWYGPNIAEGWSEQEFGPGDLAHTVGLFHYHAGTNKNIPIVHSGHIAAFSGDERVRVRDWTRPSSDEYFEIDAYIVQCAAFEGASGSPVFVRKTASAIGDMGHTHRHDMERVRSPFGHNDPTAYGELYLLGLWHGHWQVDEVALTRGRSVSNPAGYGIVVPAKYIFRVMNMPKLKEPRDKILAERKAQRARKLPSADALPRGEAQKRFDGTLREMLNTPPNPKVTGK